MTRSKKHLLFMEQLENSNKHKEEEDLYKELDKQKDNDFINHIVAKSGYNQLSW
jgi:hypothetical protein